MSTSLVTGVSAKNLKSVMTYLKPEVYEELKALAEKEDRSLSNLIARIIAEWMQQRRAIVEDTGNE